MTAHVPPLPPSIESRLARRWLLALAVIVAGLLLVSCGSDPVAPTPQPTPTPKPTPAAECVLSLTAITAALDNRNVFAWGAGAIPAVRATALNAQGDILEPSCMHHSIITRWWVTGAGCAVQGQDNTPEIHVKCLFGGQVRVEAEREGANAAGDPVSVRGAATFNVVTAEAAHGLTPASLRAFPFSEDEGR